jgi:hypothetical protein
MKMQELLKQFLDKMYPDYNESNEYLDNSTRAHRNGLRAGYTQGWKDCLKHSEEAKELVDRLKATEYANAANFDKYVEGIEQMKRKLQKLKQLMLLTDPVVSGEQMNEIALKQWNEFIREFPDEQ